MGRKTHLLSIVPARSRLRDLDFSEIVLQWVKRESGSFCGSELKMLDFGVLALTFASAVSMIGTHLSYLS